LEEQRFTNWHNFILKIFNMKKVLSTLLLSAAILFVSTNAQAQTKAPLSDSAKAAKKAARAEKKAEKAKAAAATTTTPAVTPAPAPTPAPATKTTTTPKTVTQGVNKSADKAVGTDAKGRTIYEGPKGGRYVLTAAGNKEYIKKPS
jgi:colicin import membrane protein